MPTLLKLLKFLKRYAIASVCCVLTLALGVMFYLRASDLEEARSMIEQRQKESGSIKGNLRNANGLREQLADLKVMLSTVDARLVRPEDLASNLQYFYRIESETGAKILLLRQLTGNAPGTASGPSTPKGPYKTIPYSLIIEGSFPQVMLFLTRLERGPHFNHTLTFTAQRGATDSPEGIRSGTVVVNLSVELLGIP